VWGRANDEACGRQGAKGTHLSAPSTLHIRLTSVDKSHAHLKQFQACSVQAACLYLLSNVMDGSIVPSVTQILRSACVLAPLVFSFIANKHIAEKCIVPFFYHY
jgi:hypothetical protein